MSYFVGTVAYPSGGIKTITVGFQPVRLKITVGQKYAVVQNFASLSQGVTNGTVTVCNTIYQDTTGGKVETTGKLVSVWERVSGTLTEKLAVNFDSFTATQVKFNITINDPNYNMLIEVWS